MSNPAQSRSRRGFAIAAFATLAVLIAWMVMKLTAPGMSWAAALMVMSLCFAVFGYSKAAVYPLASDGKFAGIAAILLTGLCCVYLFVFYGLWAIGGLVWLGLHVPLLIALVSEALPPPEARGEY